MKIWRILPGAIVAFGLSLCAACASVAPEPSPEEPVISNIVEIPTGPLAAPISAPVKSDAPTQVQAQETPQPDATVEVSASTTDDSAVADSSVSEGTVADEAEGISLAPAVILPSVEKMNALLALNMATVSLGRVTSTGDRVVLDAECREIFANLKPGDLRDEPEIVELYARLLETLSAHRLTDEELQKVARIYDARQRSALNKAVDSLKIGELDIFFATLFSRGANAYFGYRDIMPEVHGAITWQLDEETRATLNGLQKEFLAAGERLQRKYALPENSRLKQEEVDYYEQAIAQTDDEKALEMYPVLMNAFATFPQFWFYWARAAASSEVDQTLARLDEFDRLLRPVMRRDPFVAEAAKMRIVHEEWTETERLAELLAQFRENMDDRDWLDVLFFGAVTWAAGDREAGIESVRSNILNESETRISGALLAVMEKEEFNAEEFVTAFRDATKDAPQAPSQHVALAAWLGGHDADALKLAQGAMDGSSPIPYLVAWQTLRKSNDVKSDKVLAAEIEARHAELARRDASAYAAVLADVNLAAGQGNARAQWLLGLMYENGWGVVRDVLSAAKYYRLAAERGDEAAQTAYAAMCERGVGTKRDVKEAAKWYSRAAKSGDERAQFELGRMYRTGTGVKRDLTAAVRNFHDSAMGGYAPAQAALGELYRKGAGVPKDLVESYKWSWLAKLNGEKSAQSNLNALEGKKSKFDPVKRAMAQSQAQKLYDAMHGK